MKIAVIDLEFVSASYKKFIDDMTNLKNQIQESENILKSKQEEVYNLIQDINNNKDDLFRDNKIKKVEKLKQEAIEFQKTKHEEFKNLENEYAMNANIYINSIIDKYCAGKWDLVLNKENIAYLNDSKVDNITRDIIKLIDNDNQILPNYKVWLNSTTKDIDKNTDEHF